MSSHAERCAKYIIDIVRARAAVARLCEQSTNAHDKAMLKLARTILEKSLAKALDDEDVVFADQPTSAEQVGPAAANQPTSTEQVGLAAANQPTAIKQLGPALAAQAARAEQVRLAVPAPTTGLQPPITFTPQDTEMAEAAAAQTTQPPDEDTTMASAAAEVSNDTEPQNPGAAVAGAPVITPRQEPNPVPSVQSTPASTSWLNSEDDRELNITDTRILELLYSNTRSPAEAVKLPAMPARPILGLNAANKHRPRRTSSLSLPDDTDRVVTVREVEDSDNEEAAAPQDKGQKKAAAPKKKDKKAKAAPKGTQTPSPSKRQAEDMLMHESLSKYLKLAPPEPPSSPVRPPTETPSKPAGAKGQPKKK